ncbi:MAG TPA: hypothetical protein VF447_02305 [Terriglobales bacterium]
MRRLRHFLPAVVALCAVAAFAATDLSGTWSGPMSQGGEAVFHLKSDAKGLGGSMVGADGKDYPISAAKLDGENISMTVDSQWQGTPVKLMVTGKVSGEQMQLHIASDNGYWQTDATVKHQAK